MSSASINIRRDVSDAFYRYKMPRLMSKIEGRGNGIKTVVPNMSDIAKALSRPPSYPTKFFGCELGAQVKCDDSKERYIVNGAHDATKLQECLDGFINKFVLCGACSNPETDLIVGKNDIVRECKACGQRTPVDMNHKLTTFIIKNPPPETTTYGAKQKALLKKNNKKMLEDDDEHDDGGDDDDASAQDALTRRIKKEAAALGSVESSLDDWSTPGSTEELGGLSASMAKRLNVIGDDDDEEDGEDPYEELADFVKEKPNATPGQIAQEIEELDIRVDKAVAVLVQVLLDADAVAQLPKKAAVFKKFLGSEKAQKAFLGGIERLVGMSYPDELMPKVALLLKVAYDEELVDEEVLIAWGQKASKKYVGKEVSKEIRKKAEPFIQWLMTAESESEEDDSEEEES